MTTVYVYYLGERKILLDKKKAIMKKVDKFIQNQNFCVKEKLCTMCNR